MLKKEEKTFYLQNILFFTIKQKKMSQGFQIYSTKYKEEKIFFEIRAEMN